MHNNNLVLNSKKEKKGIDLEPNHLKSASMHAEDFIRVDNHYCIIAHTTILVFSLCSCRSRFKNDKHLCLYNHATK